MNKRLKDARSVVSRAYSLISVKAMEEKGDEVYIDGIATTPTPDRMGDVVEPDGAMFKLPVPLLWQHNSGQPIGLVEEASITKDGIAIRACMRKGVTARIDEAIALIKAGLVRGLSIGFRGIDVEEIKGTWSLRFKTWEWLELSAVTIPANAEASIQAIKNFDTEQRAASGPLGGAPLPGASGTTTKPATRGFFFDPKKGIDTMKTIKEQIEALQAARQQKAARMAEIMQKSIDEGRSTDASEQEEFDNLDAETRAADGDLKRLQSLEALNIQRAVAPQGGSLGAGGNSRGPTIIVRSGEAEEKFKGQMFTRRVIAKALAYMSQGELTPGQVAEIRWGKSNPMLVSVIKAAVAGHGSGSGEAGAELVSADDRYTGDFISYLYAQTVFNRLPLREIPANVTVKGQDGAAAAYWTGESKPIPVSKADFSSVSLTPLKVAALAVLSNELMRDSSPSAEMLIRDALVQAASQRIDLTFLSTAAASAGVSPAGLLNGVSAESTQGADGDGVRADIKALYALFISARNASGLSFVMSKSLAKSLQLMRNALGQREFPDITQEGGSLEGDPVVTGDNVNAAHLILLKPSDIYKIGDGGIQVSMSRDATIEQDTAPSGASDTPVAQSAYPVSMFQSESTAVKVVWSMNFAKRRTGAVQYVEDAAYGASIT